MVAGILQRPSNQDFRPKPLDLTQPRGRNSATADREQAKTTLYGQQQTMTTSSESPSIDPHDQHGGESTPTHNTTQPSLRYTTKAKAHAVSTARTQPNHAIRDRHDLSLRARSREAAPATESPTPPRPPTSPHPPTQEARHRAGSRPPLAARPMSSPTHGGHNRGEKEPSPLPPARRR